MILILSSLPYLSAVADERKKIQEEIESAFENEKPGLAIFLLVENRELFPTAIQHQPEWLELKSTVLLEAFRLGVGYTFPQEIANFIKEGAISKAVAWANKEGSRRTKYSNPTHIL